MVSAPTPAHACAACRARLRRLDADGCIATAKHFIGDGGTAGGKDQGVNPSAEAEMINIHGQGYYGALAAGAQTVMASFNSWTNEALGHHRGQAAWQHKAMLTEILKGKMGFDGLVVSDWNGIGQVRAARNASCPQAINAGIDMVMVPNDWKAFIANTVAQVAGGRDPDVAHRRRGDAASCASSCAPGCWTSPSRPPRRYAGKAATRCRRARSRAQAVRESLVLLKNEAAPAAAAARREGAGGRQERRQHAATRPAAGR